MTLLGKLPVKRQLERKLGFPMFHDRRETTNHVTHDASNDTSPTVENDMGVEKEELSASNPPEKRTTLNGRQKRKATLTRSGTNSPALKSNKIQIEEEDEQGAFFLTHPTLCFMYATEETIAIAKQIKANLAPATPRVNDDLSARIKKQALHDGSALSEEEGIDYQPCPNAHFNAQPRETDDNSFKWDSETVDATWAETLLAKEIKAPVLDAEAIAQLINTAKLYLDAKLPVPVHISYPLLQLALEMGAQNYTTYSNGQDDVFSDYVGYIVRFFKQEVLIDSEFWDTDVPDEEMAEFELLDRIHNKLTPELAAEFKYLDRLEENSNEWFITGELGNFVQVTGCVEQELIQAASIDLCIVSGFDAAEAKAATKTILERLFHKVASMPQWGQSEPWRRELYAHEQMLVHAKTRDSDEETEWEELADLPSQKVSI